MSSSEDMFLDISVSPTKMSDSSRESSPSPVMMPSSNVTPGSPSATPPKPTQTTPSSPSPSPVSPHKSEVNSSQNEQAYMIDSGSALNIDKDESAVKQIKIEFYDSKGVKVRQSRYTNDVDIIDIVTSLIRGNESKHKIATVSKMCESGQFKQLIQKKVLQTFSQTFSDYLSTDTCPLKNSTMFSEFDNLSEVDLSKIYDQCLGEAKEFVSALCQVCFGVEMENIEEYKNLKQRLMAVIAIAAYSRNQKTNTVQKILGEYFKFSNTGKQALQLLQRLGLTLVPVSIRENQDTIGSHFLHEIKERKQDIELWHERRVVLEHLVKKNRSPKNLSSEQHKLTLQFIEDKYVDEILDLGDYGSGIGNDVQTEPDSYILGLVKNTGDEEKALDEHIDARPKLYDVTYDNVDIGRTSSEYLIGQQDQSFHWTSSIVVEDVVDAREIADDKVDRNNEKFEERIDLTEMEKEHLLADYVQLLLNIIKKNYPAAFPDLVESRIKHQYSKDFEDEVKIWTGPLVCENESTLDGMSKIITSLTDELCPTTRNRHGAKIPICPTTFSGDQKTEKASRSAQLGKVDNGSMRDKLSFIEGRHELLHFMFMITDVALDIFADSDNLEEASSLSRLIKLLNPKIENKKGKDAFYAFRDVFSDIFVAQLGESLRSHLDVPNLESDVTPDYIKSEPDPSVKMKLFRALMRKFVRKSHEDYKSCAENFPDEPNLPPYYPHEKYLSKSKRPVQQDPYNPVRVLSPPEEIPQHGRIVEVTLAIACPYYDVTIPRMLKFQVMSPTKPSLEYGFTKLSKLVSSYPWQLLLYPPGYCHGLPA